jgi:hypothetical protein
MERQLQAIELASIDWGNAKRLFGESVVQFQSESRAMLLRAELAEAGFACHWYVAPRNHYLFFAPRYRADERWRELSQWYVPIFDSEPVMRIKEFARSKRWSVRKSPILARLNIEPLADFGIDFANWNDLVRVEEYVLPIGSAFTQDLLMYLREWEKTFEGYMYRQLDEVSPVVLSANADLTYALQATPLGTEPGRMIDVARKYADLLEEVMSEWSREKVLQNLFVQDTCPMVQRHDLVKGYSISSEAQTEWDKVYELRLGFLEKFPFPWFYVPLLAMLGGEGGKKTLTAEQLIWHGLAPLTRPVCPAELQARIGSVALELERAYPILVRKPVSVPQ